MGDIVLQHSELVANGIDVRHCSGSLVSSEEQFPRTTTVKLDVRVR